MDCKNETSKQAEKGSVAGVSMDRCGKIVVTCVEYTCDTFISISLTNIEKFAPIADGHGSNRRYLFQSLLLLNICSNCDTLSHSTNCIKQ